MSSIAERQGKHYPQKRVEVYYLMEKNVAVTVTVYAFYGEWEKTDADTL